MEVLDWIENVADKNFVWFAKRLSANDTLASGAHQAGPYIPKHFLFKMFPELDDKVKKNPETKVELSIDSHPDSRSIRVIYYNNKFSENKKGGRNEARLTGFGGIQSALLDPESTGSLTIFAFKLDGNCEAESCHVWVSRHATEEDIFESYIGSIEPGTWKIWSVKDGIYGLKDQEDPRKSCWLEPHEIPPEWLIQFPTGLEIIQKTVSIKDLSSVNPDQRLVKRRECEFEIFRSVEEAVYLPEIKKGFDSIEEFTSKAQSILQSRKSRSGRSLELHAKTIFEEEGLKEHEDFSHQPISEDKQKPDFLFPSEKDYKTKSFPDKNLRMLAVKTTCKDRWRQILNEAARVEIKHLLTLQEGVSENQFKEMQKSKVQLVVPNSIINSFPKPIRPHLQTFESFIGDLRLLKVG